MLRGTSFSTCWCWWWYDFDLIWLWRWSWWWYLRFWRRRRWRRRNFNWHPGCNGIILRVKLVATSYNQELSFVLAQLTMARRTPAVMYTNSYHFSKQHVVVNAYNDLAARCAPPHECDAYSRDPLKRTLWCPDDLPGYESHPDMWVRPTQWVLITKE